VVENGIAAFHHTKPLSYEDPASALIGSSNIINLWCSKYTDLTDFSGILYQIFPSPK
jgi:hypothetical protein